MSDFPFSRLWRVVVGRSSSGESWANKVSLDISNDSRFFVAFIGIAGDAIFEYLGTRSLLAKKIETLKLPFSLRLVKLKLQI